MSGHREPTRPAPRPAGRGRGRVQARASAAQVRSVAEDGAASDRPPRVRRPALFTNRELSWLDFNDRVLQLAEDESLPLIERVKFLAIFATNLDEFFMIRVAGVHDQVDARIDARGPDGLSPTRDARGDRREGAPSSTAATRASSPR